MFTFIDICPKQFEVTTMTAFDLMHENPEASVDIFNDSIVDAEIMGQ